MGAIINIQQHAYGFGGVPKRPFALSGLQVLTSKDYSVPNGHGLPNDHSIHLRIQRGGVFSTTDPGWTYADQFHRDPKHATRIAMKAAGCPMDKWTDASPDMGGFNQAYTFAAGGRGNFSAMGSPAMRSRML